MSAEEQLFIIKSSSCITEKDASQTRIIILSTSIAESSLTIPDIISVVNFYLLQTLVSHLHTSFSSLKVVSKL